MAHANVADHPGTPARGDMRYITLDDPNMAALAQNKTRWG